MTTQSARVRTRKAAYRGRDGYSITGTDTRGRQVSIFALTREGADDIVAAIKGADDHFDEVGRILRSEAA